MSVILLYLLKLLQFIGYGAAAAALYLLLISAIGFIGSHLHERSLRVKVRRWREWERGVKRRG